MTANATGIKRPMTSSTTGTIVTSSGEDRLWESVIHIMETPRGTRPMDPTFGVATMVYDPMTSSEAIAFGYAEAIERCEPRIQDINVIILEESGDLVKMLFELTPRDQLTPLTRIYPHYRKV